MHTRFLIKNMIYFLQIKITNDKSLNTPGVNFYIQKTV